MPNKKYLSGRRAEYELMNYLKDKGMTVIRASGSHGNFDIIAADDENHYGGPAVYFIQIKSSVQKKMSKKLRNDGMKSILEASPRTAIPLIPYKILAERLIGNREKKWSFKSIFQDKPPEVFRDLENEK